MIGAVTQLEVTTYFHLRKGTLKHACCLVHISRQKTDSTRLLRVNIARPLVLWPPNFEVTFRSLSPHPYVASLCTKTQAMKIIDALRIYNATPEYAQPQSIAASPSEQILPSPDIECIECPDTPEPESLKKQYLE